jgi:hypothetical protein
MIRLDHQMSTASEKSYQVSQVMSHSKQKMTTTKHSLLAIKVLMSHQV